MIWATRARIHFDRAASAWLIARFVDRDATFVFLEDGQVCSDDSAILFGIEGATLGAHGAGSTTFQRILEAHGLRDPALARLGRVVEIGVGFVMGHQDAAPDDYDAALARGVLAVAEGVMLTSASDDVCLVRSEPIYDALYVRLQAQDAIEGLQETPLGQAKRISNAVRTLRTSAPALSTAEALERAGS